MLRSALVKLLVRHDMRPTILRLPTSGEQRYIGAMCYSVRQDEFVRTSLSSMLAHAGVASSVDMPLPALNDTAIDALIERDDWGRLGLLLGKMYEAAYYPYAELTIDRLSLHERARRIPHEILSLAYRVPVERAHEFTDACTSIDSLARLMNVLVDNKRWDVVDDFLGVAKKTYRSGGRVALARVVLRRGEPAVPPAVFATALATDPIVSVRSLANYELFWGG